MILGSTGFAVPFVEWRVAPPIAAARGDTRSQPPAGDAENAEGPAPDGHPMTCGRACADGPGGAKCGA